MTRLYSVDLRERVVRAVEAGLSRRAAVRRFEVSVSLVVKLVQRWRRNGTVAPDRYGGWKRPALADQAERVHALVAAEPDLTLAELRARLAAEAIHVSPAAISRFLIAEGLTRKKRRSMRPSRRGRTSPRRGRSGETDSPT
jgi:transposase